MGCQYDSGLIPAVHLTDKLLPNLPFDRNVQTNGRLVQEQHLRIVKHSRSHLCPHSLTQTQLAHRLAMDALDIQKFLEQRIIALVHFIADFIHLLE